MVRADNDGCMPAPLAHFAINADDVEVARSFYGEIFGWTFTPWGPPGFFHIETEPDREGGIRGALQQRRAFSQGHCVSGLEGTFAVEDVDATAAAVRRAGGTILMERFTITGVGHLIFFADPSGNPVGAMEYDASAGENP